ncbi:MAG: hypothetical protein R2725_04125 [Solirubrobacterales bacterium]
MDEHETPINGQATRPAKLRRGGSRLLHATEERLIWPLEDAGRAVVEIVSRGFEGLLWVLQRGLVWPLQDRLDGLGRPARAGVAVASTVAVVATVAIAIGVLGSGSGSAPEPASELVAEPAPQIAAAPAETPAPEPEPDTLEGAAPAFKPGKQKQAKQNGNGNGSGDGPVAEAEKQAAEVTGSASGSAATDTISSSPANSSAEPGGGASASASAAESGRPAGKKALAVARRFADAFVVYETGGEKTEVRRALRTSATKELSRSLLRRPPRLPANVEVPKAKVVNVVAGPSHGSVYPVSVSLLRVGLTSELRLEMERRDGEGWRVTNVLG